MYVVPDSHVIKLTTCERRQNEFVKTSEIFSRKSVTHRKFEKGIFCMELGYFYKRFLVY